MDTRIPIAELLSGAGIDSRIDHMRPIGRGGNNKAWRIETMSGSYVAKQYFRHAEDQRDRLAAEFAFVRYASSEVPDRVPVAIASDPRNGIGLYSFVQGSALRPGSISEEDVVAAADFFRAINPPDRIVRASALPTASEACFSIASHLSLVRARIERLHDALSGEKKLPDARDFIDALWHCWREIERNVYSAASEYALDPAVCISPDQRCVSPSDFGFHNALRSVDGKLRFLDFEYAGWDDPAKMIGDFFSQLAVPVPARYFDLFVSRTLSGFPSVPDIEWRARLLRPVYQVKWCCIALNVFLPVHLARRRFADPGLDEVALKRTQLYKAQSLYQSIRTPCHDVH